MISDFNLSPKLTCAILQQYCVSTWLCSVANTRWAPSSSSWRRSSLMLSSVSRVQSSTTWLCLRMLPTSVMRCNRCRISSFSTDRMVAISCSSTWTRWSACWSKRSMLALSRCCRLCLFRGHSLRCDLMRMRGIKTLQLFGHSSSTWPQCIRCSCRSRNRKILNHSMIRWESNLNPPWRFGHRTTRCKRDTMISRIW